MCALLVESKWCCTPVDNTGNNAHIYIVGGIISGIYWLKCHSELITVAFTVTLKAEFEATVGKTMFLKVVGDSLSCPDIPLPVMLHVCQKYQQEKQSNMSAPLTRHCTLLLPMKDLQHRRRVWLQVCQWCLYVCVWCVRVTLKWKCAAKLWLIRPTCTVQLRMMIVNHSSDYFLYTLASHC